MMYANSVHILLLLSVPTIPKDGNQDQYIVGAVNCSVQGSIAAYVARHVLFLAAIALILIFSPISDT